ncbi:MAG: hypothetical protein U1E47_04905 [Rivihabitans pingtungensis]
MLVSLVQRYQVDTDEAANPDIASYPSFNAFFTCPLKAGARPLAQMALVCPWMAPSPRGLIARE